ncbi:hypothetical protein BFP70_16180 [Thioclava sp. SK-1]|nr:hypothetical protein BFP70_16180 [Thioclava sp. SK-1]
MIGSAAIPDNRSMAAARVIGAVASCRVHCKMNLPSFAPARRTVLARQPSAIPAEANADAVNQGGSG